MECGVGYIHDSAGIVEFDAVRPEWRRQAGSGSKQWTAAPDRRRAAAGTRFPNDAIERIRYVNIAKLVERQRIEAGARQCRRHELRGGARRWVHAQDFSGAKVDD